MATIQIMLVNDTNDNNREYTVEFKWTVSRGQDTYGYNIVTALVNGVKIGRAMGGGYDMKGKALDNWMSTFIKDDMDFYGLHRYEGREPFVDGACGMENLLSDLGLKYKWIKW